jgi:hypothetical protein
VNPIEGQMMFFYEEPVLETGTSIVGMPPVVTVKKVRRIFVFEARMSPITFKIIAEWMANNVKNHEQMSAGGEKPADASRSYG